MLKTVDLTLALDRKTYRKELPRYQVELRKLAMELYRRKRSLVVVYEGWDAAGKGGNIRRVTEKLDPRGYQVYSISAPGGEDATHHYLWRFWRRLIAPDEKQIVIFDRSWYGRVLVERVEQLAEPREWQRAFREINELERQLIDAGVLLVKLWIQISREEQRRRFEDRELTAHKSWKLTEEDWRNREKWPLYETAVEEMLAKTSTLRAPWTIVEGNDKPWARVRALRAIVDHLTAELWPEEAPAPEAAVGVEAPAPGAGGKTKEEKKKKRKGKGRGKRKKGKRQG